VATIANADGTTLLDEYTPFRYRDREDNISHLCGEGDTWPNLAERYYSHISERACGLWWIAVDFQPDPVVDPTLRIAPGRVVYLPSAMTVMTEILGAMQETYL